MAYRHQKWVTDLNRFNPGNVISEAMMRHGLSTARNYHEFPFNDHQKYSFDKILGSSGYWGAHENTANFGKKIHVMAKAVTKMDDPDVNNLISEFRVAADPDYDFVVLRNVFTSPIVPTPTVPHLEDNEAVATADRLNAIALASVDAVPVAYMHENGNKLARNVKFDETAKLEASSQGNLDLGWHQDNCGGQFAHESSGLGILPYMPSYLAFSCIFNEEQASTSILRVDDVITVLKDYDLKTLINLQENWYKIGAPDSNQDAPFILGPVICRHGKNFLMRYDPELVSVREGLSEDDHRAAEDTLVRLNFNLRLADILFRKDVCLRPGDSLLFNNYRVIHRRLAFTPIHGDQSRWLRRYYGLTNSL